MTEEQVVNIFRWLSSDSLLSSVIVALLTVLYTLWTVVKEEKRANAIMEEEEKYREELKNDINNIKNENAKLMIERKELIDEIYEIKTTLLSFQITLTNVSRLVQECQTDTARPCPIAGMNFNPRP